MAVASKTYVVGEVLTAGTMNTFVRDNLADLQANKTVMKAGTYTGDGTTSQEITGIGFTPLFVFLWNNTADGNPVTIYCTTAEFLAQDPDGLAVQLITAGVTAQDNSIIAFGSGSFTVDDRGSDNHPNKDTEVYYYIVWGQE